MHACSPIIPPQATSGSLNAVMSKKLWNVAADLTYYFIDGTDNKKNAVRSTISTWVTFANISFSELQTNTATIRVSFAGAGSWSAVGQDALLYTSGATLNLGWITDQATVSAEDRATILHEFGHALGMMHEHQSPARGEHIHLKELEVYNFYRPLLGNDDRLVKSQVIDVYNTSIISNYSHLDLRSIMMYFMPGTLNEEGIDIPVNLKLSDLDKAFITLNYPRKTANADGMTVQTALDIVDVPTDVAGNILKALDAATDNKDATNLQKVRQIFSDWNMKMMALVTVNQSFVKKADLTSTTEHALRDSVGTLIANPIFQGVVKNIINSVFATYQVPMVYQLPGSAQDDVQDTIRILATNSTFAQLITDTNTYFSGQPPLTSGTDSTASSTSAK